MNEQTQTESAANDQSVSVPPDIMGNCRQVTAPIPPEHIREWFANKDLWFIVNYSQSKLKGTQFLTYLTNLGVPCDIRFDTPIHFDDYEELLLAYMKQNSICGIAGLNVLAGQMLLWAKGLDFESCPYETPIPVDYIGNFVGRNQELVDKWLHFLDSSQVFAIKSIGRLNKHFKPEEVFEVIDDRSYIGTNVATLYSLPEFTGLYTAMAPKRMSYFKPQFEEYMFKGAHLAHHFMVRNCVPAILFSHFVQGVFKASEIDSQLFKTGVFDPSLNLPEYIFNDENSIQDGQPVIGEAAGSDPVPSQPEPGNT